MANIPSHSSPNLNNSGDDFQSTEKLKQTFGYIFGVIVLALAGYFGWTYLQHANMQVDTVAADKFAVIEQTHQSLALSEDEDALQKLNADIDTLVAEHGSTIYAWQALMIKARTATDNQDYTTALEALKKATQIELNDSGLHAIAQLRYATILLANGDLEEARKQASTDMPISFEAKQQELLGDIYMAENDQEQAERAYDNAWSILAKRSEDRPLLRLKLEGLGINPEPIEPKPQVVGSSSISQIIPDDTASDSSAIQSLEADSVDVKETDSTDVQKANSSDIKDTETDDGAINAETIPTTN